MSPVFASLGTKLAQTGIIMDLFTHIIIRRPYIINMAPYTEINCFVLVLVNSNLDLH